MIFDLRGQELELCAIRFSYLLIGTRKKQLTKERSPEDIKRLLKSEDRREL